MTLLLLICLFAPQDKLDEKKVAALIERLASDDLSDREKALGDLQAMGPAIKTRLEAALPGASAEVAARLRAILDKFAWEDRLKEAMPPVVRLTLEKKKRTLDEILDLVRDKSGWRIQASAMNLRDTVELGWADATALQILDDVCRTLRRGRVEAPLLGGHRFQDGSSGLQSIAIVGSEKPDPAVAHWNQFRIAARNITIIETRSYMSTESSASVALVLSAQPGVSVLKSGSWVIDEITDDSGKSLKSDPDKDPFATDPETGDARDSVWFSGEEDFGFSPDTNAAFEVPAPEATRIVRLKAHIRLTLAGKAVSETRKIAEVQKGGEIRIGDAVVTISKVELKEGKLAVAYRVAGKHQGHPMFEPLNAEGKPIRTMGGGSSSEGTSYEQSWHVRGEPALLRINAKIGHRTIEVPVELKDIPLPKGE